MKPLLPDVIVNGEVIAAERIAAEAQNHPAPQGKPGLAWKAAARALAVRTLLLQEAARRGLTADPQETLPGQLETAEEALIRQLLDLAVEFIDQAIHRGIEVFVNSFYENVLAGQVDSDFGFLLQFVYR